MRTPRRSPSSVVTGRAAAFASALAPTRTAAIAVALASALGAPGAAGAAELDPERCAAQQPRIEELLQNDRATCLQLASRRESRGLDGGFAACEERALARWNGRMERAGCDLGGGVDESAALADGEPAEAWVELGGETRQVRYRVVDGVAIFEGDMILGTEGEVRAGDRRIRARLASGLQTVQSHTRGDFGWSKNVVPFEISSSLSDTMRNRITQAVAHWNENTIVRLQARDGEGDYVRFVPGDGCRSFVGRKGGKQEIELSSDCSVGNVIHEIGHAVGLYHEQNRSDRDDFIVVDFDNIDEDFQDQFEKGPWGSVNRGSFDFNSRMLYAPFNGFAIDGDEPTMTKLDGSTWTPNLTALSTGDIVGVTRMVTALDSPFTLKDKFRNKSADRCMDGASGGSGAAVEARSCTGAQRQRWLLYTHPRTTRKLLINERSGMCLHVPNGSSTSGLDLVQVPCHGGTRQAFSFLERSWPWDPYKIRNVASQRCVALESTSNGGDVEQRTCGSSDQQKWFQELF